MQRSSVRNIWVKTRRVIHNNENKNYIKKILAIAVPIMLSSLISELQMMIDRVLSGIKGYGEPSWMLKTQLFGTVFVIAASSVMVLVLHMGIIEIFIMVVVDETLRLILNSWKLHRISRKPILIKSGPA